MAGAEEAAARALTAVRWRSSQQGSGSLENGIDAIFCGLLGFLALPGSDSLEAPDEEALGSFVPNGPLRRSLHWTCPVPAPAQVAAQGADPGEPAPLYASARVDSFPHQQPIIPSYAQRLYRGRSQTGLVPRDRCLHCLSCVGCRPVPSAYTNWPNRVRSWSVPSQTSSTRNIETSLGSNVIVATMHSCGSLFPCHMKDVGMHLYQLFSQSAGP